MILIIIIYFFFYSTVLRVDRTTNRTAPQQPILSGLKTAIAYYNSNFTNGNFTKRWLQ